MNSQQAEDKDNRVKIAIIGAGPGGLAAAANAAAQNIPHVLFEKSQVANTIYDYQVGKHVMAEPSVLPLRSQIAFSEGSREEILNIWNVAIADLGICLEFASVTDVLREKEGFKISTTTGVYYAEAVVLGIGVQGSPRTLGVPGEGCGHVAYTLADPGTFQNMDILVVGAGDAAIENALALSKQNRVTLVNRSSEFPRAKAANSQAILQAIKNDTIRCYSNSSVSRVESQEVVLNTETGEVALPCSHIVARLGAIPPRSFLESMGIELPSKSPGALPQVTERYETNVPGLFAIGALVGYPLIKQAMNQGFEVVEHILGKSVEPADQPMIRERLALLGDDVSKNLSYLRDKLGLFSQLSVPQLREMVIDSSLRKYSPGEYIFVQHDYTDSFFSIVEGSVAVEVGTATVARLSSGDFFGEMSLLSGRRRSASIRVIEESIILETQRRQILKLVRSSSSVRSALDRLFLLRALETQIFPSASRSELESLLPSLEAVACKKDEIVFKEGDVGDYLYIIKKGSVQVSKRNESGEDVPQAYIAAGNYFGEMALLSKEGQLRSATVTAVVPCELLRLSRDAVHKLLLENPKIAKEIREVADERRVDNIFDRQRDDQGDLLRFVFKEGITDADNALIINSDLCVGCDNCEAACAATHEGTSRLDRRGGKSFASVQVPISCRHCENPLCMLDCPPNALERQADGEVVINDSCIGCENCVKNCPYGVIQMVYPKASPLNTILSMLGIVAKESLAKNAKAVKCDMCNELPAGPACVRACPTGAAMRVNPSVLFEIISEN